MAEIWLEKLKSSQKTCLVKDDIKKIHYTFGDGLEMAEEYNTRTDDLLVRKWKRGGGIKSGALWEFEVGEEPKLSGAPSDAGFMESMNNPIFMRKDSKSAFQWRIRNLPYPKDTYDVKVDNEANQIIIKTTNKKYYKKFNIPDMDRCNLPLSQDNLSIAHANNTLIVTYEKPEVILDMEKRLISELSKMKSSKDGDVECNPS